MKDTRLPARLNDRYAVVREIAVGGMASVYLARDERSDAEVAIKVLEADFGNLVGAKRFEREIAIASRLSHPNIVPLLDSGIADGRLYFVMPFIDGPTLRTPLARLRQLDLTTAIGIARDVAAALDHAHREGIVHRDVKPENILLHGDRALLSDFGIARAIDWDAMPAITYKNVALGTAPYMSPEQMDAQPLDGGSDIYSLGCVMYEMLTGEVPFSGRNFDTIRAKKAIGAFTPLRALRPTVSAEFERAVHTSFARARADRFASASDLVGALATVRPDASGPDAAARVASAASDHRVGTSGLNTVRQRLRRRRVQLVLTTTALLGVAATTTMLLRGPRHDARQRRLVVAAFENRTGDSTLGWAALMAADVIAEAFQRTGSVEVVPTVSRVVADRRRGGTITAAKVDPVTKLSSEWNADLVVTGSFYVHDDSIVWRGQINDVTARRMIGAVQPIAAPRADAVKSVRQLSSRLVGLLSLSRDDRVSGDGTLASEPPTTESYQAFSDALLLYAEGNYASAHDGFLAAYAADSMFVATILYASICSSNLRRYAEADAELHRIGARRLLLNAHDRAWLEYREAFLAGNSVRALEAIKRAAVLAPASKAVYNFAVQALELRQPAVAESALRTLPVDRGAMRGWAPYWDVLASALHEQGKHEQELVVATDARRRFWERPPAYFPAVRALAAVGDSVRLAGLLDEVASNARATPLERAQLAREATLELDAHGFARLAAMFNARALALLDSSQSPAPRADFLLARASGRLRAGAARDALADGRRVLAFDSTDASALGFVGVTLAALGDRAGSETIVRKLASDSGKFTAAQARYEAGRIAAAVGDTTAALNLLRESFTLGAPHNLEMHRDPVFSGLRASASFRALPYGQQP